MTIHINTESLEIMKAHAIGSFPNECCGFFFGQKTEQHREVTKAYIVRNAKEGDQRRRFAIDPLDYMKAEHYALENKLALLGVYHSHPLHPAIPSEHDLRQAVPEFSYIILSVDESQVSKVTSWRLNDQHRFDEETIIPSSQTSKTH